MCAVSCIAFLLYSLFNYDLPALSLHSAPSAPLNLTFTPGGVLNDSVTLTWLSPQHPNGIVQFYQLQQSSPERDIRINTTDTTTTTIVLSDLTPGIQYNFSVRAFTVAFGPFSAQLSVHTADGEDTCSINCYRRECPVQCGHNTQSSLLWYWFPFSHVQCPQCHIMSVQSELVPPQCW